MKQKIGAKKLIAITSLGGALEFFDFTIFALFSVYIAEAFFPGNTHATKLINTFAVFAVGYFARPLGGLLIGHLGDKRGRKLSLLSSVNLLAIATLLTALLPGYQTLGFLAPVLLLLLRLLQGIAIGGEIPGAITFLVEYFHHKNPVPAIAMMLAGVTFGNVIASLIGYWLTAHLSHAELVSYGWRIPFAIGSALGFIGYLIRRHLHETDIFVRIQALQALHRYPFISLLKTHKRQTLAAACLTALTTATIFLFLYIPTYSLTVLHRAIHHAYWLSSLCFVLIAVFTLIFGLLNKLYTPKRLITSACVGSFILAIIGPEFLHLHDGLAIFCGLLAIVVAAANSCYTYCISQLFPTAMLNTGIAVAYNLGVAFFGALSPLFFTASHQYFHTSKTPFIFLAVCALITLIALRLSHRNT